MNTILRVAADRQMQATKLTLRDGNVQITRLLPWVIIEMAAYPSDLIHLTVDLMSEQLQPARQFQAVINGTPN